MSLNASIDKNSFIAEAPFKAPLSRRIEQEERKCSRMSSKPPKKSLSWAPSTCYLLATVNHVNDMSKDDRDTIWYEKNDYQAFKQDIHKTRELALLGRLNCDQTADLFCERGLEHVIKKKCGALHRERRRNGLEVVIGEQYDQKLEGISSPDFLAKLYADISASSRHDAHTRGLKDEEDVVCYADQEKVRNDKTGRDLSKRRTRFFSGGCSEVLTRKNSKPSRSLNEQRHSKYASSNGMILIMYQHYRRGWKEEGEVCSIAKSGHEGVIP
jgi:hypothetical protein